MHCRLLENQIHIAVNGQYRLCCISNEDNNTETIFTHTPQEWLKSNTIKKIKESLSNNQWPDACKKCQIEEELGNTSKRLDNVQYGPGISHLDLRFGNSCNLKCISCNPRSSSSIAIEELEMNNLNNKINPSNINWYDEKFISYFENLPLKEVYIAGGEPMMLKYLPQFLDKLDPSVTLRFNTNGTIYNKQLENQLRKFQKIIMSVSIDAIGKKIEYIRFGSNWINIETNIKKYSDYCNINITPCISILNALYYDEIINWSSYNKFEIFENMLITPNWLNLKNAPISLKEQIKYFHSWKNQGADINEQKKFIVNIQKLDKFRNINIKDYLPEIAIAYDIT